MSVIEGRTRPLRNRVTPFGELVTTPERGLLMGNRGCLHDDDGIIVRNSNARGWISCVPTWPGTRRELMAPGRYTELFFLDEPTALAAGHRPCWQCRHDAFVSFATAWANAFELERLPKAPEMDAVLDLERGSRPLVQASDLSDGTIVTFPESDSCWLIEGGAMRRWSFGGYGPLEAAPSTTMVALTPLSVIAVLRAGYQPLVWASPRQAGPVAASQ